MAECDYVQIRTKRKEKLTMSKVKAVLTTIAGIALLALAVVFIFAKNILIAAGKAAIQACKDSAGEVRTLITKVQKPKMVQ